MVQTQRQHGYHLPTSLQSWYPAMVSSKILATIVTYNVAMMCDPETIVTWAIVGVLTGLRQKTLLSELLLLAGL